MNSSPLFSVLDSDELNALFKALIEAKFRPHIPNRDLSGSRFVVAMIERVFEAQRNIAVASGNPTMLSNLDTWQRAEENPSLVATVRERIKECPKYVWLRWSRDERIHFVQQLLSPLCAEQPLLEELLNEMPVV